MTTSTNGERTVLDTLREVVDGTTAARVFGTPITQGGITVLPAAKVSGGAGGGSGTGPAGAGEAGEAGGAGEPGGTGGGVGLSAKPLGVFVIKADKVSWQPAVDVNKIILGAQVVAVVAMFTVRAILKARDRARA
jgi:uncharacterized spore protein YtfJ